jgi:hypothetical protein
LEHADKERRTENAWRISIYGIVAVPVLLERDGFRLNRRGFPNQEVSDSTCWLGRRLA